MAPQVYLYNDTLFRQICPAFANTGTFPEALLQLYWDQASSTISNTSYGFLANLGNGQADQGTPLALNLFTAHLAALGVQIANGENPGIATGATIDKVNVSLMVPPYNSQFTYWLGQTPYGQQLMAMLSIAGVGGTYRPSGLGRQGFNDAGNCRNWFC